MTLVKALIIDDSKIARVTLRKKLQTYGLTVEVAESAVEAYEVLPKIMPDIIFMDHLMPGVSGFEATRHIRQMPGFNRIPIVMCTGKEHDGYLDEALAVGANYILSKPPVDEQLDAILKMGFSIADTTPSPSAVEMPAGKPVVREPQPLMEATAGFGATESPVMAADRADIEDACRAIIAGERAALFAELKATIQGELKATIQGELKATIQGELKATIEAELKGALALQIGQEVTQQIDRLELPEPVPAPAFDTGDIEAICRSVMVGEKTGIVTEVLSRIPKQEMAESPAPKPDMELVRQLVDDALSARLSASTGSLKTELVQHLNARIEEEVSRQSASAINQDISGILDLRLNVVLVDKFAEVDKKLAALEATLTEKITTLKSSSEMMGLDPDLILEKSGGEMDFKARKGIESQLDQIIDRQEKLGKGLKVAIAALVIAVGAALGVAGLYLQ